MDLIVDANVLFAALIKEGFTEEFEKHQNEILLKTKRSQEEFGRLLESLRRRIVLVPLEELVELVDEAQNICPDPNDIVYFALALKLQCAIWTNDSKLKEQDKIIIYNTADLAKAL